MTRVSIEGVAEAIASGEVDPSDLDPADPLGFLIGPGVARSLASACYRYARHAEGIDTVLTGTGKIDHLLDNIESIGEPRLPEAVLDRLAAVFGRVETVTGEWAE